MTTSGTITFDQMERCADHTFALALFAKHASIATRVVMLMTLIAWAAKALVRTLSAERLESLTQEQAIELTKRLQETHDLLLNLCQSVERVRLYERSFFAGPIRRLQESTEDLGDVIEDLILSENEQFRKLMAGCSDSLFQGAAAGSRAGM